MCSLKNNSGIRNISTLTNISSVDKTLTITYYMKEENCIFSKIIKSSCKPHSYFQKRSHIIGNAGDTINDKSLQAKILRAVRLQISLLLCVFPVFMDPRSLNVAKYIKYLSLATGLFISNGESTKLPVE